MGTPGDKSTLEKVVAGPSTSPAESDKEPSLPVVEPSSGTFESTPPSEMGVLSRLPEFHLSNKPDSFQHTLEQASIEDYFSQTKYYTENVATLYPVAPTFQDLDQPGPSGLQTIKTKSGSDKAKKKKKQQQQQERAGQKKNHPCPICHKSFSTGDKFNKHYQTHSSAAQFKCEHCKKSFSSKFKLVRHRLIHSDKKPFSCTVCERTFHRKDHLKNHIKVHSPTKKLYECEKPDCNKQYTSLLSYRKHLAVHAAEEGNLTCQICYAGFDNKEEILYHLKIHAGSRTVKSPNEKKYVCDLCDRRFFTKKDVRRHLVVHTGMRDFLCQFCPQRFGRKDHLVRHIKKSHHKQYSEETVTQIKLETSKPETITSEASMSEPLFSEATFASIQDMPSTSMGPSPDMVRKWVGADVPTKRVLVKIEPAESSFKAEEDLGLEGVKTIFEEESLAPLNEDELFLSSQSSPSELKEFYTEMFKEIVEDPASSSPSEILLEPPGEVAGSHPEEEEILDSQVFEVLEPSDDNKLPLPGFSQTFQPPPPP